MTSHGFKFDCACHILLFRSMCSPTFSKLRTVGSFCSPRVLSPVKGLSQSKINLHL